VKPAARKWRGRDGGAGYRRAAGLAGESRAELGKVEAEGAAEASEQLEVGPRAAAAVEHERRRSALNGGANERRDEPAEAAEPEMARLGAGRGAQQVFHAAHCSV